MGKYLIINAEDLGLSRGINKGIIQAYSQGLVTSATALVNMPHWPHGAKLAASRSGLGVGLHFNLTCGRPLSEPEQVPSLVNSEGLFLGNQSSLAFVHPSHVRTELCNQLAAFSYWKLKPTHIDSHHGIHVLDNILPVVLAVASRLKLPVQRRQQPKSIYDYYRVSSADVYWDNFGGQGANRPSLEKLLSRCPHGISELRCRPGYVDLGLEQLSPYNWERERELAVLSAMTREGMEAEYGIIGVNYRAMAVPEASSKTCYNSLEV